MGEMDLDWEFSSEGGGAMEGEDEVFASNDGSEEVCVAGAMNDISTTTSAQQYLLLSSLTRICLHLSYLYTDECSLFSPLPLRPPYTLPLPLLPRTRIVPVPPTNTTSPLYRIDISILS